MIVPAHWAEAVATGESGGRRVSVRRFGWSDEGEAEAARRARERADEALKRILSGAKVPRREPRVPYNGAEGVPIREEILERHGDAVVTRNSYGARCLNTPDVLFADVDFPREPGCGPTLAVASVLGAIGSGLLARLEAPWGFYVPLLVFLLLASEGLARLGLRILDRLQGGPERAARGRVTRFLRRHPGWRVRLYRTPAGFRVLALHRRFDPADPEVREFFAALSTDPIYRKMCLRQRCFRARLTPKPWRIGIEAHLKPRPGVWPVNPDRKAGRDRWIADYEAKAEGYSACRFVEELGEGAADPAARALQVLHDDLCGADLDLPIA